MDVDELTLKADELHKSIYGEGDTTSPLLNTDDDDDTLLGGDTTDDEPIDTPDKKFEELEQRYKTLEGRYNAETSRMNTLISTVFSEKEQLANKLASITAQPPTATDADNELAELQTEYPTLYKGFSALLDKKLGEKMKQTEDVVASMTQTTDAIQKDSYLSRLDDAFPQWREIKDDPKFSEWLGAQDRYTTLPKMQLLIDADSRRNHVAVANIYQDFARENGLLTDDGVSTAVENDNTTQTVTRNVAPNTTGNPTPSLNAQKGFITRAEIGQIYKNRMKGQYSDEEFAKIEAKVFKMTREGKVR